MLSRLAGSQEVIEEPLAIGKAPAQRFQLVRRCRQQRERELHDVVEGEDEAHRPSAPLAPALGKTGVMGAG